MLQVKNEIKKKKRTKKKPRTLKLPMCFETMTKPDILTVLEWYVEEGDVIEPPADLKNLPPLLNVDAPYYGGSEILIPVPQFLRIPYRVARILKPAQTAVQLGDPIILLVPVEQVA